MTLLEYDEAVHRRLAEPIRERLRYADAWAAARGHCRLDERLLAILEVLADQFGVGAAGRRIIDLRLTHTHLAAATGATRATITRLLGVLRRRHLVGTVGTGSEERICLYDTPSAVLPAVGPGPAVDGAQRRRQQR
ncbi:helix-turn-helix domain-containing protein [Frankia sp. CiP3]|uniref:helix-turn-helix domain-containing protein n=1 Tax=Frankia sp. CiP3 TaxID=2880971 RepID=UPI001EF40EFC|nr:helix-turn-helix domain-containing protein [Frankia sp. CiP3]